uniref:Nucleotide binding oligomerization domain containing 1 n=1 Tax=Astyanax mexicanus TaxID=7994 RepID=A0A3B1IHC1_ASTMX
LLSRSIFLFSLLSLLSLLSLYLYSLYISVSLCLSVCLVCIISLSRPQLIFLRWLATQKGRKLKVSQRLRKQGKACCNLESHDEDVPPPPNPPTHTQHSAILLDILGEQGSQQGGRDIFITGTLGVGQVVLLQKLQNLWSKREFKNLEQSSSSMFGDLIFKHNCYPDLGSRQRGLRLHVRFRGPSFSRSMDNDENPDGTLIRRVPEVRKLLKGSPFRAGLFGKKGVLSGFLPGTTSKVTWLCIFRTTNQGSSVCCSVGQFSSTSCSWVTSPRPGLLKEEHRLLSAFAKLPLLGMEKGELHFARRKIGFLRGPVSHYDACGGAAFLTAFSLVKSSRFSCRYDPFMTNEHFQFTNLFLCGLLSQSPKAAPSLEHLVPPLDLKKKRRALKSYLSSSVRIHLRGLPRYPSTDIQGSKVHVMPNFLWILRCIFETHSEDVARLTAKGISADYIKLAYCNIYSADCSSLGVDLDNNNISDYGVKQLVPSFSKMDSGKLTDSSIEVLSRELIRYKNRQGSGVNSTRITSQTAGAKLVAQIIEECPHIMTVKKISPVLYFCEGNCKCNWCFRAGRMWGNSIGDEGAEAFAEALKNHPKLTNLSLSANGISSEGGRSLARALKENSSLHIFCVHVNVCFVFFRLIQNSISDDAASELQEALRRNTAFLICKIKGNSTFLSALYF